MTKKKVLANIKNPIIDAIINQRFVFQCLEDAENKVKEVETRFVKSTYSPDEHKDKVIIWIRGYDVTEKEKEDGCVGNFVIVHIDSRDDGKFTLSAHKLIAPIAKHPNRKRKKFRHPDWGYWVLRRIKKNWRYETVKDAYKDLMQIAEDFPDISIPGQNKLYTIIYRKTNDGSLPLFRVILEVETLKDGGFTITCRENTYKADNNKTKEKKEEEDLVKIPVGKFTSKVSLQKNKRVNIDEYLKEEEEKEKTEENSED